MTTITPLILGSGMSGQAIAKSMAILGTQNLNLSIASSVHVKRDDSLKSLRLKYPNSVLCIANPHGLHAKTILAAQDAGFTHIICEKPACVNLQEISQLRSVTAKVAVLHGYRTMWGPQELRRLVSSGDLGDIISIEGRYWQSSAAARSISPNTAASAKSGWKNDQSLSGPHDVLLDLTTHWLDLAAFTLGSLPTKIQCELFFANSEASHRDTHNHLSSVFPKNVRAVASISKTVHGATNELELSVLGTKASATWRFLTQDELTIGLGADRKTMTRQDRSLGSGSPSFHGMGWLEGYLQICSEMINDLAFAKPGHYPTLFESLDLLEILFRATQQPK